MEKLVRDIARLFESRFGETLSSITKLPQSGSIRVYFRILHASGSCIATYGNNVLENDTFIYFSRHFRKSGLPVPEIYAINEDGTIYLQEDFGDESLLNRLEAKRFVPEVYELFKKSLKALASLQIEGNKNLDYHRCITSEEFGRKAIISDLLYFKYYFLDTLQIPYEKDKLVEDFDRLSAFLARVDHKYFMFRDFQSRNIMIKEEEVYFIDYQGGMKGALQYDVASMLWQARADLPAEWKESLLEYYIDCVEDQLGQKLDRQAFITQFYGYVLIRLLQVLGAYGFRGLFERKAHFLASIPQALRNLRWFVQNQESHSEFPEFSRLLHIIIEEEIIERFESVKATEDTPLVVRINSFSYKKGLPEDLSGNGGGFVFDCRGVLNPGRIKEYKTYTGRDKSVIDYLEQRTRMIDFLNSVYNIIDITVEDYIRRGFENLQINFGCTGGQHRSVYAAESLARYLKNKYNVKIELCHIEQEAKNWINSSDLEAAH